MLKCQKNLHSEGIPETSHLSTDHGGGNISQQPRSIPYNGVRSCCSCRGHIISTHFPQDSTSTASRAAKDNALIITRHCNLLLIEHWIWTHMHWSPRILTRVWDGFWIISNNVYLLMLWVDNSSVQQSQKKPSVNCRFLPRASVRFRQIIGSARKRHNFPTCATFSS